MHLRIPSSFPIRLMVFVFALGTAILTQDAEGKPLVMKTGGPSLVSSKKGIVSMRILWTVSEYKLGEGAVWGDEEARTLLFKPLDINASAITFDGKTCGNVIFEKKDVTAGEYCQQFLHATPQSLGINEKVIEVVMTNCTLPGFAEYIRLRDGRLVIYINGVFFYFEPFVNY